MNRNALLRKKVYPFVLIASYRKNNIVFKIAVDHFVFFFGFSIFLHSSMLIYMYNNNSVEIIIYL